MTVAVLFARSDSVYKTLPGTDVWDAERDARNWPGGCPVVAHPPCRAWGRLHYFAKPAPGEMNLGRLAVALVREFGGVLEHPEHSRLWPAQRIPKPGQAPDMWGGWTLPISQHWWGHRAEKRTWLYIVGCHKASIPDIPLVLGEATHVIASSLRKKTGDPSWRPEVTRAEREHTPLALALALWLCDLARRCGSAA